MIADRLRSASAILGAVAPNDVLRIAFLADPNELLAREWMTFFARRGHTVTLIVRDAAVIADGFDPAISIHRMGPIGGIAGRMTFLDARRVIRAALGIVRPDVLHVHDLTTGFGWMARLSGFHPYVITAFGSDVYMAMKRSWLARLVGRFSLSGADLVTMESHDLERATVMAGANPSRVRVVQFGVDTSHYRPGALDAGLRHRLGLEGRRVLFAPRAIAPLYDHMTLVRVLPGLPIDVVVLMSARNAISTYLADVMTLAADLGVADRITIVPWIEHDEMPSFYTLADVVVSIPFSDSVSVSVLEAMACGRPIVASDLPSPREWLADVWPELMVASGEPGALLEAVRMALSMPLMELERRGAVSRAMVQQRGERESNLLLAEELYRGLVAARRRQGT